MQDHTTAEISWFDLVGLTLSVKSEPAGTEWPTMAETDAALTLLQYDDASSVRDEACAAAGTATRPSATTVPRRRARHREERYRGRLGRLE